MSVAANDDSGPELDRRLREAGTEELALLVAERLADEQRLLAFYQVRRDLTLHPRTPEVLAARFLPGLYWRDLMALGLDPRLRPTLRRSADLHLGARLPEPLRRRARVLLGEER